MVLGGNLGESPLGGRAGSPIKARATDAMSAFLGSAQRRGGFPPGSLAGIEVAEEKEAAEREREDADDQEGATA